MDFLSGASITAIADLLKPPEDVDSDCEDSKPTIAKLGPGNIGPSKTVASSEVKKESSVQKNSKDIWDEEEVPEGGEYESTYDPRPQPEYDIVYKQAVTTEDIYLQMGNKTPTTASCEEMVVKIKLPDTKLADVELDVKTKFLDCRTSKYKLGLHLPHPVDHKSGKAEWDGKKETLNVTLKITRDLDFMNF